MIPTRRSFLVGLIAAPAVLRLGLWMPVKAQPIVVWGLAESPVEYDAAWLQSQVEKHLTEMMQSERPIFYNNYGYQLVNLAAQRVIAEHSPAEWQAHVDRSYRFAIDMAKYRRGIQ